MGCLTKGQPGSLAPTREGDRPIDTRPLAFPTRAADQLPRGRRKGDRQPSNCGRSRRTFGAGGTVTGSDSASSWRPFVSVITRRAEMTAPQTRRRCRKPSPGRRTSVLRAVHGRAPTDMPRTPAARRTRRGAPDATPGADGVALATPLRVCVDARTSAGGAPDHGAYLNGWRNASAALAGETTNTISPSQRMSWTTIWVCPVSRSHSSVTVRPSPCRVSSSTNIERPDVVTTARREFLGSGACEHFPTLALERA